MGKKRFRAGMWLIAGAVIVLGLSAVPSHAAVNLLTNGSFESGLTGWTAVNGEGLWPISVINTNNLPPGAFGESVPADTVAGGSPDPAGGSAAYFVDDIAHQSLTQQISLSPGIYEVGFDAYYPKNGWANEFDASFNGTIVTLVLNATVQAQVPGAWNHYSGLATITTGGTYNAEFNFLPGGVPAADVVVDRVYVTQVPEPGTLLLLGSGLLGLALAGSRRKFRK